MSTHTPRQASSPSEGAAGSSRRPGRDDNRFRVEIRDVGRRPGDQRGFEAELDAPAELGIGMIRVPESSPITLDLVFQSVVEGILVTGTATADLEGECSRCLEPFDYSDVFDVQELFFWPEKRDEADEDCRFVVDEAIDLEEVIRDAIVLTLPFAPLCHEDCLGLCPDCGQNLNSDPDHSHGDQVDSRWGKLLDLFGDQDDDRGSGSQ